MGFPEVTDGSEFFMTSWTGETTIVLTAKAFGTNDHFINVIVFDMAFQLGIGFASENALMALEFASWDSSVTCWGSLLIRSRRGSGFNGLTSCGHCWSVEFKIGNDPGNLELGAFCTDTYF